MKTGMSSEDVKANAAVKDMEAALLGLTQRRFERVWRMRWLYAVLAALLVTVVGGGLWMGAGTRQSKQPLVVMVSLDGVRFEMLLRGKTPHMASIGAMGALAPLRPQFPAHTFPNHFTMVTGLVPARHGIVGNVFFDPILNRQFSYDNSTITRESEWWQAQPHHGLRSASVFWPGSEAWIGGVRPNRVFPYDGSVGNEERVGRVIELARLPKKERPHLITAYLSSIDELGHIHGPNSREVNEELVMVDRLMGQLKRVVVDELKGELLIVSDHGMVDLPADQHMLLSDWLPTFENRTLFVDFGPVCSITPRPGEYETILKDLRFGQESGAPFRVWGVEDLPEEWNYVNNDRIAPIILLCDKVGNHLRIQ